jgi:cytochrome c oxidase cbb3-type subunit 3
MSTRIEKDAVTGTDTTGHEWDGIKELNTPLPKWWLYVMYATIVWSAVYIVFYPSFPSLSGHLEGVLGWSQRVELTERMAAVERARAPLMARVAEAPLERFGTGPQADPELRAFALASARAAFAGNCSSCHGAGGQGFKGYPNLVDDQWLWGGSLADIERTIAFGIRNAHPEARQSQMPRFGVDGLLDRAQIGDVVDHVLALSGQSHDPTAAGRGATVYAENCAACHGDRGEGNPELGAPRLATRVFLYGGDRASLIESVVNARAGNMPAWTDRLDKATIRALAVYVHQFGGGE